MVAHDIITRSRAHALGRRISDWQSTSFTTEDEFERLVRRLRDHSCKRLLDAGCGNGALGLACARGIQAQAYHGFDRDPMAIAKARRLMKPPDCATSFAIGDFTIPQNFGTPFDAVISQDAIYLAKNADESLAAVASLLRRGGLMTFTAYVAPDVAEGGVFKRDVAFWKIRLQKIGMHSISLEDLTERWRIAGRKMHLHRLRLCSAATLDPYLHQAARISRRMLGLDGRKGFLDSVRRIRWTAIQSV